MADEFDVDELLEAPYKKEEKPVVLEEKNGTSEDKSRRKKDQKSRSRSRDRDRKRRSRSREHRRDRDNKDVTSRSRSDRDSRGGRDRGSDRDRDRRRSRSPRDSAAGHRHRDSGGRDKEKEREKDRERHRGRRRSGSREEPRNLHEPRPRRAGSPEMTPEERDARTVFVWQLSARIRQRDLEEFFSSVGKIRDVRLIADNKTRRSKGIAYVEFREVASVQLALALTGNKLLGVPIQVQPSQAEKNRIGQPVTIMNAQPHNKGPMKLYVGSLHYNITEDMLRGIFEPFGTIVEIKVIKDPATQQSQGYGFVTYFGQEDAKKALEQLNGFELAGRPMKVNNVTDRSDGAGGVALDSEELERTGIELGTSGRLALMAKLAEGTGMEIPRATQSAIELHNRNAAVAASANKEAEIGAVTSTQCFMLSNMFEAIPSTNLEDIKNDVIEEATKYGGLLHIYVDPLAPEGNVYGKAVNIQAASHSVNALHGRFFSGRTITAAYVPLHHYHQLFPESASALYLLKPSD